MGKRTKKSLTFAFEQGNAVEAGRGKGKFEEALQPEE
jgi:hypothetical protein